MTELQIKDLHVTVDGKEIIKGLNLKIKSGEIHAIMGPNGSGKSTLAMTLMGHPRYKIESGDILLDGKSILGMSADTRAKAGLFLAFQYPFEIPGVNLSTFLRTAYNSVHNGQKGDGKSVHQEMMSIFQFKKLLKERLALLKMDESFTTRYLNEGFSGGEKKRCEILQLAILQPKIAVLDETDSGLDIDSVKVVSEGINKLAGPDLGVLLITHYQRILKYIKPDFVHVLVDGKIVKSGGEDLAAELEEKGYQFLNGGS